MAGLLLILAAPPAPVGRQLADLVTHVVADRCVPRQELVELACKSLAFVTELLPELLAFRWFVAAPMIGVVHNPPLYPRGLGFCV